MAGRGKGPTDHETLLDALREDEAGAELFEAWCAEFIRTHQLTSAVISDLTFVMRAAHEKSE